MKLTITYGYTASGKTGADVTVPPVDVGPHAGRERTLFWDANQRTLVAKNPDGNVVAAFAGLGSFYTEECEVVQHPSKADKNG